MTLKQYITTTLREDFYAEKDSEKKYQLLNVAESLGLTELVEEMEDSLKVEVLGG